MTYRKKLAVGWVGPDGSYGGYIPWYHDPLYNKKPEIAGKINTGRGHIGRPFLHGKKLAKEEYMEEIDEPMRFGSGSRKRRHHKLAAGSTDHIGRYGRPSSVQSRKLGHNRQFPEKDRPILKGKKLV